MAEYVPLEATLRAARSAGRKLLVPFFTGGLEEGWTDYVRAAVGAGADAVEIGIPFSDPIMDGPVIQDASQRALARGTTPTSVLADLARLDVAVPLVIMTSYNLAFHAGHQRFASDVRAAGGAGTILPDLSLEEADDWISTARESRLDHVLLAAPTTPDDRLAAICERSTGWVYAVGTLGVTGERATLAASALVIASRLKAVTDLPVLVGIGVSNAEQAQEIARVSDGVIVGASVVRRILEGQGPVGVERYIGELRAGLDSL